MSRTNKSGAGIFMMEMIAVVFFFILCASTCILMFVKSDDISRQAKDKNRGIMAAESMAEIWKAEGPAGLSNRFRASVEQDVVQVYWDQDWKPAGKQSDAVYGGTLTWDREASLEVAQVEVSRMKDKQSLFTMTAARNTGAGQ